MDQLPTIETDRLLLTELTAADIPLIVDYAADSRISQYTINLPYPYSEKDAIFWVDLANQGLKAGTHYIFAIRQKGNHDIIGGIGLSVEKRDFRAEIGYWIAVPFWSKGFVTEATKAIIAFGFNQLELNKLSSSHFEKNPASGKVLLKCGMHKEGELKDHLYKRQAFHSIVLYGLTKKEYNSRP